MDKKTRFVIVILLFALFIQLFFNYSSLAHNVPSYNVRDIIGGKIPEIQLQAVGSEVANLGLLLRVTWTGIDSFDMHIPGGTLFLLIEGNQFSAAENSPMVQVKFGTGFSQAFRIGGGGRPVTEPEEVKISFTEDVLIYALCTEVNEPAPAKDYIYALSVDSLESIPRFRKLISAFENFNLKIKQIDTKMKTEQLLSDEETRYAAFIDWIEEPGQTNHFFMANKEARRGNITPTNRSYSETTLMLQPMQNYIPEIWRFPAQNVIWTMIPEDLNFSPRTVRNDIGKALRIKDPDSLDNTMRQTNNFLDLLGMDRRLFVEDSLIYPIDHAIWYPPLYYTSWSGAGAGFAARMSLPYSWKFNNSKWQIMDIKYYLLAQTSGNFDAAILTNMNGSPGTDLMNRKIVSFTAMPDGEFFTVDVSGENIIIEDDFFVALFQNAAYNPRIILSTANIGRAYGFNGVNWEVDPATYFLGATVKLINSAPNRPILLAPADDEKIPISTAKFVWSKATDPDAGNIVTYDLQFALTSDFNNILFYKQNISATEFLFLNLPEAARTQMNTKIVYWRVRAKDNWDAVSSFSDHRSFILVNDVITHTVAMDLNLPTHFELYQNHPNPFNPTTTITFDVPRASFVTITVFNIMGQKIKTLVDRQMQAGKHTVIWDGNSDNGFPIGTGVYLMWMKTAGFEQIRKITLLH